MKAIKKTPRATKKTISLRLAPVHLQRLDALAERKGTDRSALIQLAVTDYLEKEKA